MASDLLLQFLTYFLSVLLCQLGGRLILKLLASRFSVEGKYTTFFISALLGFTSFTCLSAILTSGGNTVCWMMVLVFVLVFRNKISLPTSYKNETSAASNKHLILLSIIALVMFIFNATLIYSGNTSAYTVLNSDSALYARLSMQLNNSGLENHIESLTGNPGYSTHATAYHYFDLWFNALVCKLSGLNHLRSLYLVTYSHLLFMAVCGLLAFIEHFVSVTAFHSLVALSLLFIGPLWVAQQSNIFFNTSSAEIPVAPYGEKFAVYYPFILLSLLFLIKQHCSRFLILLAGLAVISFTTLPVVFVCCLCYAFFCAPKTGLKTSLFTLLLVFGALILFYFLNNAFDAQAQIYYRYEQTGKLNVKGLLLNVAQGLITDSVGFLANYSAVIILLTVLAFLRGYKPSWRWLFIFVPVLAGSVAKHTFYNTADNYQLFTNALPVFHAFAATTIVKLFYSSNSSFAVKPLFVGLLVLNAAFGAWQAFAAHKRIADKAQPEISYWLKLTEENKSVGIGEKIAWIYTQEDVDRQTTGQALYLSHLAHFNFDPVPIKLSSVAASDFISRKHYARLSEMLNAADPFYRYFNKNSTQAGQSPDKLKLEFMRSQGIRYLLVGPGAEIPPLLNHFVLKTISDKHLGITMAVLDFRAPRLVEKI